MTPAGRFSWALILPPTCKASVRVLYERCLCSRVNGRSTLGRMEHDRAATIFVTGAAGFIGSEPVEVLISGGPQVVTPGPFKDAIRPRGVSVPPVLGNLLL